MMRYLSAALTLALAAAPAFGEFVAVQTQRANVRMEPRMGRGMVSWIAYRYEPYEVIGRHGAWLQVRDYEGYVGWLHRTVTADMFAVAVVAEAANVRSGPGLSHGVDWTVERGYPLRVLARSRSWLRVEDDSGLEGWIHVGTVWGKIPRIGESVDVPSMASAARGASPHF